MRSTSSPLRKVGKAIAFVVVAVLLFTVIALGFVAFRVWHVARDDDRRPADAIVVLGAAQYNGVPTDVFRARLEHAAMLYEEGVAPLIMTTGGSQPGDMYTEAGSGRSYLTDLGIPANAVYAVETGTNTQGSINAVAETVSSIGGESVVLVSDPWHSYRSRLMARDEGLDARTSPTRHGPAVWTRENQITSIIRETGAVIWYLYHHHFTGENVDFPN